MIALDGAIEYTPPLRKPPSFTTTEYGAATPSIWTVQAYVPIGTRFCTPANFAGHVAAPTFSFGAALFCTWTILPSISFLRSVVAAVVASAGVTPAKASAAQKTAQTDREAGRSRQIGDGMRYLREVVEEYQTYRGFNRCPPRNPILVSRPSAYAFSTIATNTVSAMNTY